MLLLALVAGQSILLQPSDAESAPSVSTSCAASDEDCSSTSPDGATDVIVEHATYLGGCAQTDLHLARYMPADSLNGEPVVAIWCGGP
jgi:hypothetical protein